MCGMLLQMYMCGDTSIPTEKIRDAMISLQKVSDHKSGYQKQFEVKPHLHVQVNHTFKYIYMYPAVCECGIALMCSISLLCLISDFKKQNSSSQCFAEHTHVEILGQPSLHDLVYVKSCKVKQSTVVSLYYPVCVCAAGLSVWFRPYVYLYIGSVHMYIYIYICVYVCV